MANPNPAPHARIEQQLVLTFQLPGVTWLGATYSGNASEKQLQPRLGEEWQLKITRENAAMTAECLRAAAAEIDKFVDLTGARG